MRQELFVSKQKKLKINSNRCEKELDLTKLMAYLLVSSEIFPLTDGFTPNSFIILI